MTEVVLTMTPAWFVVFLTLGCIGFGAFIVWVLKPRQDSFRRGFESGPRHVLGTLKREGR